MTADKGKLVASARIRHNGEWLKAGDEIHDMSEQDEADYIAMGMATRLSGMAQALTSAVAAGSRPRPRRAQYERRDAVAKATATSDEDEA